MAPDVRQETAGSSCDSQVSCLAARAYQQRVNEICKAAEYNFSPEIFRIVKVIHRRPRVVYKLEDLIGTPIDGQFYSEELTPVRISSQKTYKINKIMYKRVRRGIREMLVSWQGYGRDFDSWISAASVKDI
jgi:hypothetical protein